MDELSERTDLNHINLTDADARLMKTREGIGPCYNAQAVVSPTQDRSRVGWYVDHRSLM